MRWSWVVRIYISSATESPWRLDSKRQPDNLVQGHWGGETSTLRKKSQIDPWIKTRRLQGFSDARRWSNCIDGIVVSQ